MSAVVSVASEAPLRPLEELERELTELAAHLNAAEYRWLCLLREFDDGEAGAAGAFCRARTGSTGSAASASPRAARNCASRTR